MITRRNLLGSAAAASLLRPRRAVSQTTGVTPVFINWGGWYSLENPSRQNHIQLSPPQWQFRAPWFCKILGTNRITCEGTQADVDLELQAAANVGIKAFTYPGGPDNLTAIGRSYQLYNTSAYKNLIKWAGYIGQETFGNDPWSNTAAWQANCNRWVTYLQQANYLTVAGRRVLFISWHDDALATHFANSTANVTTAFNYLRTQATAAGLGSLYIVSIGSPWGGAELTSQEARPFVTGEACTDYVPATLVSALPDTAVNLDIKTQAWWASQRAATVAGGGKYIPNALLGWDVRPRMQLPESGSSRVPWSGHDQYFTRGSNAQVATHLQNCVNFIGANPVDCDSKIMLVYAWNECSEGGTAGIPTLGDPPTGNPPTTNLLTAIKPVLTAAA